MQIELLAGVASHLHRKQAVYAIRGPNAATELAMLATLQALSPAAMPCLPALLSRQDSSSVTAGEHVHARHREFNCILLAVVHACYRCLVSC